MALICIGGQRSRVRARGRHDQHNHEHCLQIEELQAQESELRSDASQGDGQLPAVHALLSQLALSSPEETEQALSELLTAAAGSR